MRVKLGRPLDFLVISDHSENLNLFPRLFAGDPVLRESETGKRWLEMLEKDRLQGALNIFLEWGAGNAANQDPIGSRAFQRSVWEETTARADRYKPSGKVYRIYRLRVDHDRHRQQPSQKRHIQGWS